MNDAIRSEFRKLRTTRTAFGLLAGAVVLDGARAWGSLGGATHAELAAGLSSPYGYAGVLIIVALFVLVFAIRSYTDEVRHGSIVPTFLATPNRLRVLAAKGVVAAVGAAVFAVAALAAGIGVIAWYLAAHGFARVRRGRDAGRAVRPGDPDRRAVVGDRRSRSASSSATRSRRSSGPSRGSSWRRTSWGRSHRASGTGCRLRPPGPPRASRTRTR